MNQAQNWTTAKCHFGDVRLTQRAVFIAEKLAGKYGKPLSSIFSRASDLKRAYEFFGNKKTNFSSVIEPYHQQTANYVSELSIVLAVGDTSYLDYKQIEEKRAEYGPIGNGGNGLILHSARGRQCRQWTTNGIIMGKTVASRASRSKKINKATKEEKTSRSTETSP